MDAVRSGPETASLTEVAARLGIARSTCYDLAAAGRLPLPVIALGRRRVVPRAALDRLLAGERDEEPATGDAAQSTCRGRIRSSGCEICSATCGRAGSASPPAARPTTTGTAASRWIPATMAAPWSTATPAVSPKPS